MNNPFDFNPGISQNVQKELNKNIKDKQMLVNAAMIQSNSTAEIVAHALLQEIINFQQSLPDNSDVAMALTNFNQSTLILVDSIGYIGYNLVTFQGKDSSGKPMTLIQHVQQLNFLLCVVPKTVPDAPKRQIGFVDDTGR